MDFSKVLVIDDTCLSDMRDKYKNIPQNLRKFISDIGRYIDKGEFEIYDYGPNEYVNPSKNFKFIKSKMDYTGLMIPNNYIFAGRNNEKFSLGIWLDFSNLKRNINVDFYTLFNMILDSTTLLYHNNFKVVYNYQTQYSNFQELFSFPNNCKILHFAIVKDYDKVSYFINGKKYYTVELKHYDFQFYSSIHENYSNHSIFKRFGTNDYSSVDLGFNNFVFIKDQALYYNDFDLKNNMFDQYVYGVSNNVLLSKDSEYYTYQNKLKRIGDIPNDNLKSISDKMDLSPRLQEEKTIDRMDYCLDKISDNEYSYTFENADNNISSIIDRNNYMVFFEPLKDSIKTHQYFYTNKKITFESPENDTNTAFAFKGYYNILGFTHPKMFNIYGKDFTISFDIFYTLKYYANNPINILSISNSNIVHGKSSVFELSLSGYGGDKKIIFNSGPENTLSALTFKSTDIPNNIYINNDYKVENNKWYKITVTCTNNIITIYLNKVVVHKFTIPYNFRKKDIGFLSVGNFFDNKNSELLYIKNLLFINGYAADKEAAHVDKNIEEFYNKTSYSYIKKEEDIYMQSRGDKTLYINFNKEDFDTSIVEPSGTESKIVDKDGVWCYKKATNENVKIKYDNTIFDFGEDDGTIDMNIFVTNLSTYSTLLSTQYPGDWNFLLNIGGGVDKPIPYIMLSLSGGFVYGSNQADKTQVEDMLGKWTNFHIEKRKFMYYYYINGKLHTVLQTDKLYKLSIPFVEYFKLGCDYDTNYNGFEFFIKDLTIIRGRTVSTKAISDAIANKTLKEGISYTSGYYTLRNTDENILSYKLDFSKQLLPSIRKSFCEVEKYKDKYCLYKPKATMHQESLSDYNNKIFDFRKNDFSLSFNILVTEETFKTFTKQTPVFMYNFNNHFMIFMIKEGDFLKLLPFLNIYNTNILNTKKTELTVGEWNHVYIVKTKDKIEIFINNESKISVTHEHLKFFSLFVPYEMMIGRYYDNSYSYGEEFRISDLVMIHKAFNTPQEFLNQYNRIPNGYSYVKINDDGDIEPASTLIKLTDEEKLDIEKAYDGYYITTFDEHMNPDHRLYEKDFTTLNNSFSIIKNNQIKDYHSIEIEYKNKLDIMKDMDVVLITTKYNTETESYTPYTEINNTTSDIKFLLSKDNNEFFGYNKNTQLWEKDLEMSEELLESLRSIEFNKLFGSEIYKEKLYIKSIFYGANGYSSELKEININFWKNQPPVIENVVIEPDQIHFEFSRVKVTAKDLEGGKLYMQVQIRKFEEDNYYIADDWKEIQNGVEAMRAYNEKYFLPGENNIRVYVKDEQGMVSYWDGVIVLNNKGPVMTYTFNDFGFAMNITDPESDTVQVQVSIDNEIILPYGVKYDTPFLFKYQWEHRYIKVGKKQVIKVEIKDYFNKVTIQEIHVTGRYKGLLYRDTDGNYYTSDRGEILKYLDFGEMIMGQNSLPVAVDLVNHSNYPLKGVKIKVDKGNLNENINIKLSETLEPFNSQDTITIPEVFNEDDEKTFFVRVESNPGRGTMNGEFKILSEGGIK